MKKIALAADDMLGLDGEMSMHFGRCPSYVVAQVEDDGNVAATEVVENPYFKQHTPGEVPRFINSIKVNVMIAGGMGPKAIDMFNNFGIEVVTGVGGRVGNVLKAYLNSEISGAAGCNHDHDHSHGGC